MLRELIKSTTDICDKNPKDVQVLNLQFNDYGKKHSMKGRIVTVSCFEDRSKIIEALSSNGTGKI